MQTVAPPPAPAKPSSIKAPYARTVRVVSTAAGKALIIRERKAGKEAVTSYWLSEVDVGFGRRGFRLTKVIRESGSDQSPEANDYHVHVGAGGGTCECKGFLRWGHCKHVSGLAAAEKAGQL